MKVSFARELAFVVVGAAVVVPTTTSCDDDAPPADANLADASANTCDVFCVPDEDGTDCSQCDPADTCPVGCTEVVV